MGKFKEFNEVSVHFSRCLGVKVVNERGVTLGKSCDFFVDYEEIYPLVLAIGYKRNKQFFYVKWDDILSFSYNKIIVKTGAQEWRSRTFPKVTEKKVITSILANQFTEAIEYPPLAKVILDKQIVDTSGKKVVRVNDIQIIKVGDFLRVTHAEVGLRSMLRRLGYEKIVDTVVKTVKPKSPYLSKQTLINWKYVHAIPNRNIQANVKLNLSNDDIKAIHPADLADILEDLDNYGRDIIFQNLDAKTKAETLSEIDQDVQSTMIKNESPEDLAKIIEEMDTDDAADILHDMDKSKAHKIIKNIKDDEIQEELQELMEYEDDTAGGLMSTEFFEVTVDDTKETVLKKLADLYDDVEYLYDLYVLDDKEQLLGVLPLKDILCKGSTTLVREVMIKEDIKYLKVDMDWKEVASFMSKYNLHSAPVINEEKTILGIVSVDDVLPWLLHERS